MRMDTLICRVNRTTGQWQHLQIPYSYPELEPSTGLLTVQSMAEDRCIYIAPEGWSYAECLLPEELSEDRTSSLGARATVRFIDPILQEYHHVWLNDIEVVHEKGRPIFIDTETGYAVALFAHPSEIFVRYRGGSVEHWTFEPLFHE